MGLKLVISDVDGTLVRDDKSLADATVAAVARLQAAGVAFTIISARPPSGIAWLVDALGPCGPVGAFNGGTIVAPDGAVVECHRLPRAVVDASVALAEGAGADPWLFAEGRWHLRDPGNGHVPREKLSSGLDPVVVDDLSPWFDTADKLTWVSDDHNALRDLERRMQAAIGPQATVARSQPYFLDLTAAAANKGDGVAALARIAGIDLAEVAVLGDQYNDLPMFARAGAAIAMGQAPDAVREKAAFVTRSNEEDGVAHAIDTILLPMARRG